MGNCLTIDSSKDISKKGKPLPIESTFKFPSPVPSWPQGEGFGTGSINLGGIEVRQIKSFTKIWTTHEGGPDNLGATFFEPTSLPPGYTLLGHYAQPNNKNLFGWVLAAKQQQPNTLKPPTDYTLIYSSESVKKQDNIGYIWLPIAPDGYKSVGHVVTNSPQKPSLDKIQCVKSEFTEQCQNDTQIWTSSNGFGFYTTKPMEINTHSKGVSVGTFIVQNDSTSSISSIACLKNNSDHKTTPNRQQIEALMRTYSPFVYFHPDEQFLPSSVSWYFDHGALLYKKGDEANPVSIDSKGSNLPQGGTNDGSYWIDLPKDEKLKDIVKKGDLSSCQVYVHVKPMLGSTFTDISIWLFYPFNGPARAKVEFLTIPLGKIGEHVGDWEHVTLRVSNFDGELWRVYFGQHSGGKWVDGSEIEYYNGLNKVVCYSSLNGHAMYEKPGLVLQGNDVIGIRNDCGKSKLGLDFGLVFLIVDGDEEAYWVNYMREWGPKISYDVGDEIKKMGKKLPGKLKDLFEKFVKSLPAELLGEEGPTGPKGKKSWDSDEVVK